MKKMMLLALLGFSAAAFAQSACDSVLSVEITLTRQILSPEEQAQECGNYDTAQVVFYRTVPGSLTGAFSIAMDQNGQCSYVAFAKGNLQYMPANPNGAEIWRFAEHQYDRLGNANDSLQYAADPQRPAADAWYDLFGYGTSGYNGRFPYLVSSSSADYANTDLFNDGEQYDWGVHNPILCGGDQPGIWRTLTADEWDYILARKDADGKLLYFQGQINVNGTNVCGLFLLPDGFVLPDNQTLADKTIQRGDCAYTAAQHQFTLDEFADLEELGVVFLPAAGYRNPLTLNNLNTYCWYWTASMVSATNAKRLLIYSNSKIADAIGSMSKCYGGAVRLVHMLQ